MSLTTNHPIVGLHSDTKTAILWQKLCNPYPLRYKLAASRSHNPVPPLCPTLRGGTGPSPSPFPRRGRGGPAAAACGGSLRSRPSPAADPARLPPSPSPAPSASAAARCPWRHTHNTRDARRHKLQYSTARDTLKQTQLTYSCGRLQTNSYIATEFPISRNCISLYN